MWLPFYTGYCFHCNHLLIAAWCLCCPQSYCDDPDLVLELKNLIVIFADTLQVGLKLHNTCFHHIVTCRCAEINKDLLRVYVFTGLWFPSESPVWPAVWGQRPVQWNSTEEVVAGFQVSCADIYLCAPYCHCGWNLKSFKLFFDCFSLLYTYGKMYMYLTELLSTGRFLTWTTIVPSQWRQRKSTNWWSAASHSMMLK